MTCRSSIAVAVAAPALQQAADHAHRLNHLGIAQAHLGEAVIPRAASLASVSGPRTSHSLTSAMRSSSTARAEREQAEKRMQQEDDADIDRRPRQVEDGVDAGAGDELAEGVEVAQRLAARTATPPNISTVAATTRPASSRSSRTLGARQDPRAHDVEPGERAEGDQQRDGQHDQRRLAAGRDHPVVDLQHVERRRRDRAG